MRAGPIYDNRKPFVCRQGNRRYHHCMAGNMQFAVGSLISRPFPLHQIGCRKWGATYPDTIVNPQHSPRGVITRDAESAPSIYAAHQRGRPGGSGQVRYRGSSLTGFTLVKSLILWTNGSIDRLYPPSREVHRQMQLLRSNGGPSLWGEGWYAIPDRAPPRIPRPALRAEYSR